jgi:electron-transferring-flavoprotein dehydrogenase
MNVPRIKGTHTAMKSGMLAADAAFREIVLGTEDSQAPLHMNGYARQLEGSWVFHELTQA